MTKERNSNIELLRNLAMFLVLVVHSMYSALGAPTIEYLEHNPLDGKTRIFVQCLAVVSVNLFILISGWFGIKPKIKSVLNLLFQYLFLYSLIYALFVFIGLAELNQQSIMKCINFTGAWFIPAYLGLYLLSPILNSFVENASKKAFANLLFWFFAFEFYYGWVLNASRMFERGYTTFSFIGLYLLARYIRLYQPKFSTLNKYFDLVIYLAITIFISILIYHIDDFSPYSRFLNYSSPNVVFASLFLFLFFTKISFQNRFVNWCGASAFAVYLIHTNPNITAHFKKFIFNLHANNDYFAFYTLNLLFLIAVFFGSIFIDKIRIFVWEKIVNLTGKS